MVERLAVGVAGRRRVPAREEQREVRFVVHRGAARAVLGHDGGGVPGDRGRLGQPAEGPLDPSQGLVAIEVPDDDQRQVVGRIVGVEERAAGLDRDLLDVASPPDHGPPVGMGLPDQRRERLETPTVGRVLRAEPALLEHDLALARERAFRDVEVQEALGFEVEHQGGATPT